MFDMVRPMSYPPHSGPPHDYGRPILERVPISRSSYSSQHMPPPKVEDAASESAWERGLRHAKEVSQFQYFIL